MSGYTDEQVLVQDAAVVPAFLQKPFTPDVLARTVREVLDGTARPPLIRRHAPPGASARRVRAGARSPARPISSSGSTRRAGIPHLQPLLTRASNVVPFAWLDPLVAADRGCSARSARRGPGGVHARSGGGAAWRTCCSSRCRPAHACTSRSWCCGDSTIVGRLPPNACRSSRERVTAERLARLASRAVARGERAPRSRRAAGAG